MAKQAAGAAKKQPGRMRTTATQMWQAFQITRKSDPNVLWLMILALVAGIALGVVLALLVARGSVFGSILYVVVGVLLGVLAATIVLSRRAERAAYAQIEGQPGAVGAVLRSSLKRGWRGSEVPVAVNRTRDALYRAVGRPGVVLIAEGPTARTRRMADEERRRVGRVAPNVPVTVLQVGQGDGEVRLGQINRRLGRLRPKLTRAEVLAVSNRLDSLGGSLPVPKGVDPTRTRPVRR